MCSECLRKYGLRRQLSSGMQSRSLFLMFGISLPNESPASAQLRARVWGRDGGKDFNVAVIKRSRCCGYSLSNSSSIAAGSRTSP